MLKIALVFIIVCGISNVTQKNVYISVVPSLRLHIAFFIVVSGLCLQFFVNFTLFYLLYNINLFVQYY